MKAEKEAQAFKLARHDLEVDAWIERKYLNRALREQQLEHFSPRLDVTAQQSVF